MSLEEYRKATDLKIKVKVSKGQVSDWKGTFKTGFGENDITLQFGVDVLIDESGEDYCYVTLNFGNYKSYKDAEYYSQNYFAISLVVINLING